MESATSPTVLQPSVSVLLSHGPYHHHIHRIYGVEPMPAYIRYGESLMACRVVQAYCKDKIDPTKDPGCFVWPSQSQKLDYFCDSPTCHGQGKR